MQEVGNRVINNISSILQSFNTRIIKKYFSEKEKWTKKTELKKYNTLLKKRQYL